jgi:hypothetical protein
VPAMRDGSQSPGGSPGRGHAGLDPAGTADESPWAPLYYAVCTMIGDGRLEPDALILPVDEAATLWGIPADAARRAYTALERGGLLGRCPDCHQWVVLPMASCLAERTDSAGIGDVCEDTSEHQEAWP